MPSPEAFELRVELKSSQAMCAIKGAGLDSPSCLHSQPNSAFLQLVLAEVGKAAPGVSSGAPAGLVAAAAGPLVLHRLCSIGTQATSHQI